MGYPQPPFKNDREGWSYPYYEVMSSLRKAIKLHDKEQAIYWVNVMVTGVEKGGVKMVAKQLWIMSAEDLYDYEVVIRAALVFLMADKVAESDQVFYLAAQMCDARMWWEDEKGREVNRLWSKAIGDVKDPDRRRGIPPYALDRHTQRGWANLKAGRHTLAGIGFDDRLSGTGLGQQKSEYLYLRDGQITEESDVWHLPDGTPDDGFLQHWLNRVLLEGITKDGLEPNDPLPPDMVPGNPNTLFDVPSAPRAEANPRPRPAPYKPDLEIAAGPHGWEC